jgi:heme oxygenase
MKQDLDFYLGEDWSKKFGPPPAVVAYVNRIREVETEVRWNLY